jgi:hypothetical protein
MADEKDDAGAEERQGARAAHRAANIVDRAALALAVLPDGAIPGAMVDVVKVYDPELAAGPTGRDLDLVPERIYAAIEKLRLQPEPSFDRLRREAQGALVLAVETLVAFRMDRPPAEDMCRLAPAMTDGRRTQLLDGNDMRQLQIRRDEALSKERVAEVADLAGGDLGIQSDRRCPRGRGEAARHAA